MANIGKTIKSMRIKKGMTQDELAEKLFVSRQTVSNYENNKSNPDIDILVKIAEVLDTDVNTIIYGEKEEKDRKKRFTRDIILAVIWIVFAVAVFKAMDEFKEFMSLYFVAMPRLILGAWGYPLIMLSLGWLIMEIVSFAFKIEPKKTKAAIIIHRILLIAVITYFVLLIPLTYVGIQNTLAFWQAHINRLDYSLSISFDGIYGRTVVYWVFMMTLPKTFVFAIVGGILRLTKLKEDKKEIAEE